MYTIILINVDELWLKGKNRPMYFKTIKDHICELLETYHKNPFTCFNEDQRLVAESEIPFEEETILALLKVPGIHSILPARQVSLSLEEATQSVIEELGQLESLSSVRTFKVETRRSYKGFPMTSMEVSSAIGEKVIDAFPHLKVAVKGAELIVEIRVMKSNIYVATRRLMAVGGLPVGTAGHVITLISGGFDSPVASYMMSKRGCRQTFIFFYAYPFVGEEVKDKILKIVRVLGQYQRFSRLVVVSFGEVQDLISKNCDMDYRTLLFRKAMIRCSTLLAKRVKAEALVTGDALGQVSSQTIWNISALDSATTLPIFRPLIGFNKIEILELSKKIETHDISVIPHDDACSLFAPKHPVIRPHLSYLEEFEKVLPLDEHLYNCLNQAEVYNISLDGTVSSNLPTNGTNYHEGDSISMH